MIKEKIKNILENTKTVLKSAVIRIIQFYYGPFETVVFDEKKSKNKNKTVIKKIPKSKVHRSGVLKQLLDYYGGRKRVLLFLGILISLSISIWILLLYPNLTWLSFYVLITGFYTTLYSGLYYVFQRKRDVIDGFTRLMQEYMLVMDVTTFKNFIKETNEIEYPNEFKDQIIEMKQKLNTKESSVVLKEFFEDPRNYYPELQVYKGLAISAISSHDESIVNALSDQIDFIKKSSTIFQSKLGFLKIFVFLVIGFIFLIQPVLVYQFKSVFSSGGGGGILSKINVIPSNITYTFFLVFGGLTIIILMISVYFGMFREGQAIKMGLVATYLSFIISAFIYFMGL